MNFHNPATRKVMIAGGLAGLLIVLTIVNLFYTNNVHLGLISFGVLACALLASSLMVELVRDYARVNENLEELDKARGEFISIASHQLRTPPATFKWYIAALESGEFGKLPEEALGALSKMEAVNNSQISLIDDLLNTSRIERGRMEFFFESGDLLDLTEQTIDQLIPQARMKKVHVKILKPDKPLPSVVMDKEKIRQVINNFIDNAIKYSGSGEVQVKLFEENSSLRVEVIDTGKGIAATHLPYLFEKYNRGKDSVLHAEGLGLGLYVAKLIVSKHNGQIWAESDGEGKGAKFVFTLPVHNTIQASTSSTLNFAA